MITIDAGLTAAVSRESRKPLLRVRVERYVSEFTYLGVTQYVPHRFQKGTGYYIVTGYNVARNTIYYKRLTNVTTAGNWSAGWSSLAAATDDAYVHDLYVSGIQCLVVYSTTVAGIKELWARESADGGQTWGAAYSLIGPAVPYTTYEIMNIAIADMLSVYYTYSYGPGYQVVRVGLVERTGVGLPWSQTFADWENSYTAYAPDFNHNMSIEHRHFFAQDQESQHDLLMMNSGVMIDPLAVPDLYWRWIFHARRRWGMNSIVRPAMGGFMSNTDTYYELRGMSRAINGYYFAGMREIYGSAADRDGISYDGQFFIAKTQDGDSYHFVPTNLKYNDVYPSLDKIYIAGAAIDQVNYNMCVPVACYDAGGSVWLCPASSWWGYLATQTDITSDIIEDVTISRSEGETARSRIVLENGGDWYCDHAVVRPGSKVRIEGGYQAALGATYQKRFTGVLLNKSETIGPDKTASFDVMDMMYPTTSLKAGRPIVLMGQNRFYAEFSDPNANDKMIHQSGTWSVDSNRLTQTALGLDAVALCGYDPDDTYSITVKMRAVIDITGMKIGIALWPLEYPIISYVVYYDKATQRITIGNIVSASMDGPIAICTSSATYAWGSNTDYWLKVIRKHDSIWNVYCSTDGVNWTQVTFPAAIPGPWHAIASSAKSIFGPYCYIPEGSLGKAAFSEIRAVSMKPPLDGSDVMKHLAVTAGMGTSEIVEFYDDFPDIVWNPRWITSYGSWALIVPGACTGWNAVAGRVATYRTDISAPDITVKRRIYLHSTAYSGFALRMSSNAQNGYAGCVNGSYARIVRFTGGVQTILCSVPITYPVATLQPVDIIFSAQGPHLSLLVNGQLRAEAYDTTYTDGYVGMFAYASVSHQAAIERFLIDGFYKPIGGIVTVRPEDTIASVMNQVAGMYDNGMFFCNYNGDLTWGVFDDETVQIDARQLILDHSEQIGIDKIRTAIRAVGELAYGEVRDVDWGLELGGQRWEKSDNRLLTTSKQAVSTAQDVLDESKRIREDSISIKGHPALEPCDVIGVSREVADPAEARRVLAFNETIGDVYEMSISELIGPVESP